MDNLLDWKKTLSEFKAKADQFMSAFNFLKSISVDFSDNAEISQERQRLVNQALVIQAGITTATGLIDKGNALLKTVKGFIGLEGLPQNQLGFLPVVLPIAVVAASVTAITYWLTDFDRLREKMYSDMVAKGTPPEQASKILATVKPDSISSGFMGNIMPFMLLGLGLWAITR